MAKVILSAPVQAKNDFQVLVDIDTVEMFDAGQFDLVYDATALRIDNIASGKIGDIEIPISRTNEISKGRTRVILNIPGIPGVTGEGYLAVINMANIAETSQETSIGVINGFINNILAEEIKATWEGTTIKLMVSVDPTKEQLQDQYNKNVIKDIYQLEGSTLKRVVNPDPLDKVEVTIGSGDGDFTPDIQLTRWDEVGFKIKPILDGVQDKQFCFDSDKVLFETLDMDYDIHKGEGCYKFIWSLKNKPVSNIIRFRMESHGLIFYPQRPLNEEYQDGWSEKFKHQIRATETELSIQITEDDLGDFPGTKAGDWVVIRRRPQSIVNSVAVYHAGNPKNIKGGKVYAQGKAFHILAPHFTDSIGQKSWGKIHINEGYYNVEIPQDYLDKAVFPIRSNDTFGYTSIGGSSAAWATYDFYGYRFTGAAGTATTISLYCESSIYARYKGVLVLQSDLNIVTNGVGDNPTMNPTAGWITSTFSSSPTIAAVDYVVSGIPNNSTNAVYYDTGDANYSYYDGSNSYDTPTDPTDASTSDEKWSIYVTYTPSAGGISIPVAMHHYTKNVRAG